MKFSMSEYKQKSKYTMSVIYLLQKDTRCNTNGMEVDETKVRVPLLFWIPILFCGVLLFFADVLEHQFTIRFTKSLFTTSGSFEDRSLAGFTISNPGCKIPYMDPFDENIAQFIKPPSKPMCNNGKPPLFASNLTSIFLLETSLPKYNVSDENELKCCYKPFWRREPENGESDNKVVVDSECHAFQKNTDITEEFIIVNCTYDNTTIYIDTFSFVPLKNTTGIGTGDKKLNVLLIGLDAVSRLNLHRQMLKTVNYLQEQEAVELLGYNKVGDNTFPNLMPVLTGLFEEELKSSCWPSLTDHFDNCSFVWKLFKERGYLTVYGEDASWMGLFNYQRKGFRKQTTDYAYNYFNRFSEELIGNSHVMNVFQCEGGRLIYKDLLDYISKFVATMNEKSLPYFGFFWGASLSHDNLNMPNIGDQDYYIFFKKLLDEKLLDNTALIFMSDHGIRWGDIRQTFQGRMEERLPFVYLLLPKSFRQKHFVAYENLKVNTRRLTTPFDLHETLLDLANTDLLDEENLTYTNQSRRGISFFRRIDKNRTCEDAAITSHWCTCQQSEQINITYTVTEAARSVVSNINYMLRGYAQCAELALDEVINARIMRPQMTGDYKIFDYMLTLRTSPNQAVFEATVRTTEKNNSFEIIGSISRLNLYGKQSLCITDFHLKLYCYCKKLLP
ncbi:unnamed protein product [Phyllotreta striolata]|uniref:Uncharacterized protein n=1 Tax=Phyllotreta striolata TaxID=444603 RepID=A0A9N9XJ44_PHYSR|nr:unnamed protein product [Phyllotreta striolata]